MNLLDSVKIFRPMCGGSTVGNGGAGVTTFIDCDGWSGVLFVMNFSSMPDSTGTIIVQNSSAASTGAGILQSTYSNALKGTTGVRNVGAVDVYRPIKRYVRLKLETTTGLNVIPIAYGGRRLGSTEARVYCDLPTGVHVVTT